MINSIKGLLLFDLDGTLLQSNKTISARTVNVLQECRKLGYLVGISTSRSETNCITLVKDIEPDILITSGGALVNYQGEYIYQATFTTKRTNEIISIARKICGSDCEISVDTKDQHFWNYKIDPNILDQSWGDTIWDDFNNFSQEGLKICVEIFDDQKAKQLANELDDCDCIRFSDGYWYKLTKKDVTKESTIQLVCQLFDLSINSIYAFGDDYSDIGMLKMAGTGVAMGNAIKDVKEIADVVIGSNDEDGIAIYLEELISKTGSNLY